MRDELVVQAVEAVENLCGPDQMSKAEAVDFLENIIDILQGSIEALREELGVPEQEA